MSPSAITPRSISDLAWLLARNARLPGYILAFIAPAAVFAMLTVGTPYLLLAAVAERALQLLVIGLVVIEGARLLPARRRLALSARFFGVGFAIEILITSGAFLIVSLPGIGSAIAALCLFLVIRTIAAVILYPMPFMDPLLSTREALVASRVLTAKVSLSAIGTWPLAFFVLASGLAFCVYPDGRLWWSAPAAQVAAGAAHLVFVFRGAAAALLCAGVTLPAHGRQTFGSPRILLLSGLLLWGANFVRAYTLPPGPLLTVGAVRAFGETVTVELAATDLQYAFRGFTTQRFFIGGAEGYPVTGGPLPEKPVSEISAETSADRTAATDSRSRQITLTFASTRKVSELAAIEDLHLWYGAVKITPIEIEQ